MGKTSLAYIISREMGVNIKATSGPVVERPGDLAALLTNLEEGDILFIDEIHRLNHIVEEVLYPAMEDYQIDIMIGQGPAARSMKLPLKPFTLIGATTRSGLADLAIARSFRPEFSAGFLSTGSADANPQTLGRDFGCRCGRRRHCRDRRRSRGHAADRESAAAPGARLRSGQGGRHDHETGDRRALQMLEVDPIGLDKMDTMLLVTLIDKFAGGPVGVETLAAAIGEEKDTIEDVYEPFLIQAGFLQRTPRGRVATQLACEHFGRKQENRSKSDAKKQPELF